MSEIKKTAVIVKDILEEYPETRNSDMGLYVRVCERVNPSALCVPFWVALMNLKAYKLPCIETVRRTRQKIQAECPELASTERVASAKAVKEAEFRQYAREGGVEA